MVFRSGGCRWEGGLKSQIVNARENVNLRGVWKGECGLKSQIESAREEEIGRVEGGGWIEIED